MRFVECYATMSQNKLLNFLPLLWESIRRMQYLKDYSRWQQSQADEIKNKTVR